MSSRTLKRAAATVGVSVLVALAGGTGTATASGTVQPQAVPGSVIKGGANGSPRTLMCPPEENVLSGGYVLSAPSGHALSPLPADLVETRPTADATGWTIAVRKQLENGTPADLRLYVVCTQGENTPGG